MGFRNMLKTKKKNWSLVTLLRANVIIAIVGIFSSLSTETKAIDIIDAHNNLRVNNWLPVLSPRISTSTRTTALKEKQKDIPERRHRRIATSSQKRKRGLGSIADAVDSALVNLFCYYYE